MTREAAEADLVEVLAGEPGFTDVLDIVEIDSDRRHADDVESPT